MKIAVYHNLNDGGALTYLNQICKSLIKDKNTVDLFTHSSSQSTTCSKNKIVKLKNSKGALKELLFLTRLKEKNKMVAKIINKQGYGLVLVFPCIYTQAPYILRYLKNKNTYYFFTESKREFYEATTFDHFSLTRSIARLIRCLISLLIKKTAPMLQKLFQFLIIQTS